jgi:hypothetical protein
MAAAAVQPDVLSTPEEIRKHVAVARALFEEFENNLRAEGIRCATIKLVISFDPAGGDDFRFYDAAVSLITPLEKNWAPSVDRSRSDPLQCIHFKNPTTAASPMTEKVDWTCRVFCRQAVKLNAIQLGYESGKIISLFDLRSVRDWDPRVVDPENYDQLFILLL